MNRINGARSDDLKPMISRILFSLVGTKYKLRVLVCNLK